MNADLNAPAESDLTEPSKSSPLTDQLVRVITNPQRSEVRPDEHPAITAARDVLAGAGLDISAVIDEIHVTGSDPVTPSALRLGTAATAAVLAKSAAAAAVHRLRGGDRQSLRIDLRGTPRRLSPNGERRWELLGGYPVTTSYPTGAPPGLYRTADDKWVLPDFYYPNLQRDAERFFGVPNTLEHVTKAISTWTAMELERAAADAGVALTVVRSVPEMLAEEQYRHVLADLPLVEITRIGQAPPQPLPAGGDLPFAGIRALGMGHVIAGAGLGRSLALHGADVLNLWKPGECEHEHIYCTSSVGMRSSWLDVRQDRARLLDLLSGADVFFHNRRPGFLRAVGLTADDVAAHRPGIIHVTCSLHGVTGPWADRSGFDVNAGAAAGVMALEGRDGVPALPPIGVVNDYLVAWLLQVGVAAALQRREREGGSYAVHVSLTRTALWLISLGIFDKDWAATIADSDEEHRFAAPELFAAHTPLGRYQGVTDQVQMSATPGRYAHTLLPRGASDPVWLPLAVSPSTPRAVDQTLGL